MRSTRRAQPRARTPATPVPPYGTRTLAEVVPALLGALNVPGISGPLRVPPARSACLLLIDGLGSELLARHAADAPFLAEQAQRGDFLDVGFPATTATSITSLGTGLPPGEHGIVGYTFAVDTSVVLNSLTWRVHGSPAGVDLRGALPPEDVQPHPTLLQQATAAGLAVRVLAPGIYRHSGLTRAALRGGEYHGVHALGDLAAGVLTALEGRGFCYAYCADLDLLGHIYGPGSLPWRLQLTHLDHLVTSIVRRLPANALLVVVGDHGMVTVTDPVDADTDSRLRAGVRLIAGDIRVRYVHAEPGAAGDVLAAWREVLGRRAWVLSRAAAVEAGWFGPSVRPAVLSRIGDVVVAARGGHGVVLSVAEPRESALVGHHGSLTPAEQRVPFLLLQERH